MTIFDKTTASNLKFYDLSPEDKRKDFLECHFDFQNQVDEIVVSWNGNRPSHGALLFQIKVFTTSWSEWIDYAYLGKKIQYTFKSAANDASVFVDQDEIIILNNQKASKLAVRTFAKDGTDLKCLTSLYVSAIDTQRHQIGFSNFKGVDIDLQVPKISQMQLVDHRKQRLCSPTATTAVLNFLSENFKLEPHYFADKVHDKTFDTYGNWILNTAEASSFLKDLRVFVCHLDSIDLVIDYLSHGYPVIVSVKGPLNGAASGYESGHLMVIKGYHSDNKKLRCMDPAFPNADETSVEYDLDDFLKAWQKRKGVSYIFCPKGSLFNDLKSF